MANYLPKLSAAQRIATGRLQVNRALKNVSTIDEFLDINAYQNEGWDYMDSILKYAPLIIREQATQEALYGAAKALAARIRQYAKVAFDYKGWDHKFVKKKGQVTDMLSNVVDLLAHLVLANYTRVLLLRKVEKDLAHQQLLELETLRQDSRFLLNLDTAGRNQRHRIHLLFQHS